MGDLALTFLGTPHIVHAQRGELVLANRKALALLAYMAVDAERAHSRESLLGLLWPDMTDADARNNLRVVWSQIAARLGQDESTRPFVMSTRLDLRFILESSLSIDVALFANLLAECAAHAQHAHRNNCPECQTRLGQVVALYRGEFLAGFTLSDCPDFDEWQMMWRERLHLQVIEALDDLVAFHTRAGQFVHAEGYARRQIEIDPLRESAYRQLMQLLDQQGQRTAALDVFERCRQVLMAELGVTPDPDTRALVQKIRARMAEVEAQSANPNNLPGNRTPFTGRAQEIADLAQQLQAVPTRLLTLTGSGGVGKSRLAMQVGQRVLPNFADGVWWVELVAITDAQSVARAFATALDVREQAGTDMLQTLSNFLRDKQLALIVDNCEHVREACAALVAQLCAAAPALRILATSRVPLQAEGEQLYRVPSLSLPLPDAPISKESLRGYEAIQMFVQRAQTAQSDFILSASNAALVRQICRRLDGIPLALELAAARLSVMPIDAIAERLDRSFTLLSSGRTESLPRHRTLYASIDWSYGLLPDAERALLQHLSVFSGGWTLEAVESIGAQLRLGVAVDVLDLLFNLVNHSLVVFGQDRQHQRYRMLEGIRQYAQEQLRASGEEAAARNSHAQFYARLVAKAAQQACTPNQQFALTTIDTEYDNIVTALDWATHHDVALSMQLAAHLGEPLQFWELRGHFADGRRYLEQLLAAKDAQHAALRAKVLLDAAWLERAQPNYAKTLEYARASLALSAALGNVRAELDARLFIADVVSLQDERELDIAQLQDMMAQAEQLGHKRAQAFCLYLLGAAHAQLRATEKAREYFEHSSVIWREIGDKLRLADALNYWAADLDDADEQDDALAIYAELEGIYREMGYERGLSLMQNNVGCIWVAKGEYERAKALFVSGLHIRRKLGLQRGYVYSLLNFADLAALQGQPHRAVQLFSAADILRERLGLSATRTDISFDSDTLDRLRRTLGERRYNMEWARGRSLTIEQALDLALGG